MAKKENPTVARMRASYDLARAQIKQGMDQARPGTAIYLHHVKALAELGANERKEEVSLGLSPQNLGAITKTFYAFVAFVAVVPNSRAELNRMLAERDGKALDGLHLSEQDELVRNELQENYEQTTTS